MNPGERWQRVRELFERAFEEKPADVPAWLDRNGIDDWQLREEVLSLIQHHAGAGSFLDNPAGQRLADFIANEHPLEPGQILGQYRLFPVHYLAYAMWAQRDPELAVPAARELFAADELAKAEAEWHKRLAACSAEEQAYLVLQYANPVRNQYRIKAGLPL